MPYIKINGDNTKYYVNVMPFTTQHRDNYSSRTYMFTANVGDTLTVGGSYPSVYDIVGVEQ